MNSEFTADLHDFSSRPSEHEVWKGLESNNCLHACAAHCSRQRRDPTQTSSWAGWTQVTHFTESNFSFAVRFRATLERSSLFVRVKLGDSQRSSVPAVLSLIWESQYMDNTPSPSIQLNLPPHLSVSSSSRYERGAWIFATPFPIAALGDSRKPPWCAA